MKQLEADDSSNDHAGRDGESAEKFLEHQGFGSLWGSGGLNRAGVPNARMER